MQESAYVMLSTISDATTYSSFNILYAALHICRVTIYVHLSRNIGKAGISDSYANTKFLSYLVYREEDCVIEQITPYF